MFSRLIHIACVQTSFLFKAESHSIVWIYHTLFTYPSLHGHWCYVHHWAIVSNAAKNMGAQMFFNAPLSVLWGRYPEVELLGHVVALFLIFQGKDILISKAAAPFYIPTNSAPRLPILHIKRGTFKMGQIVSRLRADGTIQGKEENR